jgi:hypothetical protein
MVLWKVIVGAILVVIAIVRVIQALPFLMARGQHEWMPVFLLVMAVFFFVGLWLLITGLRGRKLSTIPPP